MTISMASRKLPSGLCTRTDGLLHPSISPQLTASHIKARTKRVNLLRSVKRPLEPPAGGRAITPASGDYTNKRLKASSPAVLSLEQQWVYRKAPPYFDIKVKRRLPRRVQMGARRGFALEARADGFHRRIAPNTWQANALRNAAEMFCAKGGYKKKPEAISSRTGLAHVQWVGSSAPPRTPISQRKRSY